MKKCILCGKMFNKKIKWKEDYCPNHENEYKVDDLPPRYDLALISDLQYNSYNNGELDYII